MSCTGVEPVLSGVRDRVPCQLEEHDVVRAAGIEPASGLRESNSPGTAWKTAASPVGLAREGASDWTRTNTLPGKNRLLCLGATEAMPRRPSHATPRDVPPSGIEPEPLGLQPSAQTNYARVASRGAGAPRFSDSVVMPRPHRVAGVPL